MAGEISNRLAFDVGIERISITSGPEVARLPQTADVVPGDIAVEQKLADILYSPSWQQQLLDAIRTQVENREMLVPARYQAMLESAQEHLRLAAEKEENDEDREDLEAAAKFLDGAKELRDLLNTYRHLLHKG